MSFGFRVAIGLAAYGSFSCANRAHEGGALEAPGSAAAPASAATSPSPSPSPSPSGAGSSDGGSGPSTTSTAGADGGGSASTPPGATPLECAIHAEPRLKAGQPVTVRFRLVQRSAQPVYVLKWRTPLEGLRGDDFSITRDGVNVPYTGPMVKRGDPNARSYATLAPGEPLEAEVDLRLAYDLSKPGKYRIAFNGKIWDLVTQAADVPRPLEHHQPAPLACAPIDVEIGG